MNEISEKYIAEISRLYPISDKSAERLHDASDKINATLGCYAWSDVRDAVATYFRAKTDKTRPTIAQIVQILENTAGVKKITTEPEQDKYCLPRTNLWAISKTFDAVIKAMVQCQVLKPENPMDMPLQPGFSLLDDNNLPMINPVRRLRAMVTAAKNRRPDVFAPYKSVTFWEELAIAVQNNLVRLRVRDWHEFYAGLPDDIKSVIRNRGSNNPGETSNQVNHMIAAWAGSATVGVREVM